ncbi:HAD family hydrolase [Vulcanococcus limneticus]|uniref:HAD family hydrolase n=1 Tax=Vulcanococcus limneticus TaxID=2170428 RepID=UPI00398C18A2
MTFLIAMAAAVVVASGSRQAADPDKKIDVTVATLSASAQTSTGSPLLEALAKDIGIPAGFFGIVALVWYLFLQGKSITENMEAWPTLIGRLSVNMLVPRGAMHQIDKYATKALSGQRGIIPAGRKYKVIAFDLDGTLLRGLDYSWSAVWEELGLQADYRSAAMLGYMRNQISYSEWCERDYQQFRNYGLTKKHFTEIAHKITVTRHLRDAILDLRTNGLIVAIISGGLDTLLKATIPDAEELFDYICINRMQFGSDQVIRGIEPTPFDFDNKANALAAICRKHGCTLRESVFVGEGPNDAKAARVAGLTIAYPPKHGGLVALAGIGIGEDDLREILPYVYEQPQPCQ